MDNADTHTAHQELRGVPAKAALTARRALRAKLSQSQRRMCSREFQPVIVLAWASPERRSRQLARSASFAGSNKRPLFSGATCPDFRANRLPNAGLAFCALGREGSADALGSRTLQFVGGQAQH